MCTTLCWFVYTNLPFAHAIIAKWISTMTRSMRGSARGCHVGTVVVWDRPPLRIESKGLVKYKYHFKRNAIRQRTYAGYVGLLLSIRTKALCCQGDDV